jgi:LPXTG-site transpeptidase (sortase) family protein
VSLTKARHFYFKTLPNLFIVVGLLFLLLSFGPVIYGEFLFRLKELKSQTYSVDPSSSSQNDSAFARLLSTRPINISPINTDFAIVIEKIGVNAPVVPDVSVVDTFAYKEALKSGVAHASTSSYPSDKPGNTYLFAHASTSFWERGKYSNVFNLLRKLELGDRIHIFYKNDTYVYEVVNTEIVKGWNTFPLTRSVIEPVLTLQTCNPPGTTLNRLIVTAKLLEKK